MIRLRALDLEVGGRSLVRGATMEVPRGEVALLHGPSGSGKTTLLRALLGLEGRAPGSRAHGVAEVGGVDALRTSTPLLARRAALLLQDPALQVSQPDARAEALFRLENLGLAWRDAEAQAEDALRIAGLQDAAERAPLALSGGERKRLVLASLLAAHPQALLLDEPLGGLDAEWRSRAVRLLAQGAAERATLVVEHRAHDLAPLRPTPWTIAEGTLRPGLPAPCRAPRRTRTRRAASPWPLVLAQDVHAGPLRGATLEAGPGITLLVGPNGSGKTTLLRALLGLQRAEGTLRLCGRDPQRTPLAEVAAIAGYVPQRAEDLFTAASVRAELAGAGADLVAALGLAPLLDRHPFTLSGGEQQRLALAIALARQPRVLLLDEPTVGLDASGLVQALGAVRAARRDVAIVVASHDSSLVALADEVAVLEQGRIVYQGPPRRAPLEVAA
jgi:energy-coupling factor transporter ATP-binding protein EcfA2